MPNKKKNRHVRQGRWWRRRQWSANTFVTHSFRRSVRSVIMNFFPLVFFLRCPHCSFPRRLIIILALQTRPHTSQVAKLQKTEDSLYTHSHAHTHKHLFQHFAQWSWILCSSYIRMTSAQRIRSSYTPAYTHSTSKRFSRLLCSEISITLFSHHRNDLRWGRLNRTCSTILIPQSYSHSLNIE